MEGVIQAIKYIILGLIQGLTEFLPVSSSGHLVILEKLGFAEPSVFFNLLLHLASLLAVIIVMRREVWEWIKHPFSKEAKWIYILSVPTIIIAFVFSLFFEELLLGALLPTGFLATSFFLVTATIIKKQNNEINYKNALLTGVAQGFATLPGISRSGITITVMTVCGINLEKAVKLSFLMSIPIIVGGSIWEGIKGGFALDVDYVYVIAGAISAFVGGFFALKVMVRFFAKMSLLPFAAYTFLLAIIAYAL